MQSNSMYTHLSSENCEKELVCSNIVTIVHVVCYRLRPWFVLYVSCVGCIAMEETKVGHDLQPRYLDDFFCTTEVQRLVFGHLRHLIGRSF